MIGEVQAPTKVFISYSWDSEEHKEQVRALANTLRQPWGVETYIDQYVRAKPPYTPEKGWDIWMENMIDEAEFVLIVCTENYKRRFRGDEEPGRGQGVTWEGTIIRQELYNAQLRNSKFIPVVFSREDLIHVPIILNGNDKYVLGDAKSFAELGYRLRKEPTVVIPPVAQTQLSPPAEPVFLDPENVSIEPPPVSLNVNQIQDFIAVNTLNTSTHSQSESSSPLGQTSTGYGKPMEPTLPRANKKPLLSNGGNNSKQYLLIGGISAVLLAIFAMGSVWTSQNSKNPMSLSRDPTTLPKSDSSTEVPSSLQQRISAGEKILVSQEEIGNQNPAFQDAKSEGVQAIAEQNYAQAVTALGKAVQLYKNAPETLIYLNNARIGLNKAYTIAVAAPIGSNVDAALSILRGAAQAQDEINRNDGINGVPLRIIIADDKDDEKAATEIASALANNPDILGVVGHHSSGVTLATRKIYNTQQLPSISATSTSITLSDTLEGNTAGFGFRVVPTDAIAAKALADYTTERLKKQQVAVFYEKGNVYSESLKKEFTLSVLQNGGEIAGEFNINDAGFDAENSVKQAIENNAQVLMLAPSSKPPSVDKAVQIIRANDLQLKLLGGDAIYTSPKIFQEAGALASGMVVAVFWDIDAADQKSGFPKQSAQLWGAEVNWITAMTYDATQALINAIRQNTDVTRASIKTTLSNNGFSIEGASGKVRFLPNGDRSGRAQLVEVRPEPNSRFGYDFVPIP